MAARWREEDGSLNAGSSDFLALNGANQLVLIGGSLDNMEMDTLLCMEDHSILAIFEDPAIVSEDQNGREDDTANLLSALSEMLESVDGDVDAALSPFDSLPGTELLMHQEHRDKISEESLHDTQSNQQSQALNAALTASGWISDHSYILPQQTPTFVSSPAKAKLALETAEPDYEAFAADSLIDLVKTMHPYSLKLSVDEEEEEVGDFCGRICPSSSPCGKSESNSPLHSQGEILKYVEPVGDSDEEINVVSDDEEPVVLNKKEKCKEGQRMKSALVDAKSPKVSPSKEKKRVSFGPIHVDTFDSVDEKVNLSKSKPEASPPSEGAVPSPLTDTKTPKSSSIPATEPQPPSSEVKGSKAKAKPLSLQQYRQLRQKRQILVEKQGNSKTKWPSVPEAPKELAPILCVKEQGQNSSGPKTAQCPPCGTAGASQPCGPKTTPASEPTRPQLRTAKPPGPPRPRCPRSDPRNSSAVAPITKKAAVVSSDPPNPVFVPLPPNDKQKAAVPSAAPNNVTSTRSRTLLAEIQKTLSAQIQKSSAKPKAPSQVANMHHPTKTRPNEKPQARGKSTTPNEGPQPQHARPLSPKETSALPQISRANAAELTRPGNCPSPTWYTAHLLTPAQSPTATKETCSEVSLDVGPSKEQGLTGATVQNPQRPAGIEAADLTSLLEQFEETQAKEECIPQGSMPTAHERLPDLSRPGAASPQMSSPVTTPALDAAVRAPLLQTGAAAATHPVVPLKTSACSAKDPPRDSPQSVSLPPADIPEPLGTDVILSSQSCSLTSTTQRDQAAKRNSISKAIQIIAPRPLPAKKIPTNQPESPAAYLSLQMCLSMFADHDYCEPADRSSTQSNQAKPSTSSEGTQDSSHNATAASQCERVTPAPTAAPKPAEAASQQNRTAPGAPNTGRVPPAVRVCDRAGDAGREQISLCLPTPPPSPPRRGREKRRYRGRSPRSDSSPDSRSSSSSSSSCSSTSRSPERKKRRHRRSESSSCSSSPSRSRSVSRSPPRRYKLSYSRSRRSRSRSRSWSRSRSPSHNRRQCWRDVYSSSYNRQRRESNGLRQEQDMRRQKLKAIDERRVVYVGRIRRSMTHSELRERFSLFGEVECVSLHFRDRGDHYGFVTYYNMEDAFAAIDNGGKIRRPDELPFDICFGGRRQFCNSDYADLDANRESEPTPTKSRYEELDFDSLLKQAQRGLKR